MLDAIQRSGNRRRRAELRLNHDDVLGLDGPAAELRENGPERIARVAPAPPLRQHVARPPEHVARLLEPELADVSRDGRLGDLAAGAPERPLQLVLAPDPAATDYAGDQTLALVLRELPKLLHKARITIQVSSKRRRGKQPKMLRKLLWSGLYAGFAASSALAARRAASGIWRLATGEPPPSKR
jgi:hypothetical protein